MKNPAILKAIKRKDSLLFLVLFISVISLIGWLFGAIGLAKISSNYIPIAPSTALIFIILSILFFNNNRFIKSHVFKSIGIVILVLIVLFCLTVFLDYLFNFTWDLENIFIENPEKLGFVPIGRMSPLTALMFILACMGIWGIRENSSVQTKYISGVSSLLTLLVSSVLLIGYLYRAPLLYGGQTIPVALPTAVSFLLFSVTLLGLLEYRFWTFNLIKDNKITHQLLKYFLPAVVAVVMLAVYLNNSISSNQLNPTLISSIILLITILILIILIIQISKIIGAQLLRAEKSLKESEKRFKRAIQNAPFPIMIHAENGKVLSLSQGWIDITGYTLEDIPTIGDWTELAYGERKENIKEYISVLYEMTGSKEEGEYTILCKDSSERVWDFSSSYLGNFENDGRVVLSMAKDVTKRKQAEQELKESNATKDKFFSIIAHDLKSPFNSIIGFSDILVEKIRKKNYGDIEKYAEIIQQSSNRAMDLLTNLMEWSQSQTGIMEFNPEYFDLVVLITDTELLLTGALEQKSISISKMTPSHVPVFAEKKMIDTILRNLISNAIKFTYPGGKITVSVEEKQNELLVTVSDTGVGISKENRDKLFKIDQSYSTTGTQNEKGTGLGLILCKEFVEKHGGKIWVESEVNKGSTFYFTFPTHNEHTT